MLVEKRETRYRVQWYYRLFEETQRGLTRFPHSLEAIHGSLLALGELLRHTGAALLMASSKLCHGVGCMQEAVHAQDHPKEKVIAICEDIFLLPNTVCCGVI